MKIYRKLADIIESLNLDYPFKTMWFTNVKEVNFNLYIRAKRKKAQSYLEKIWQHLLLNRLINTS
jgi:hypothetical protein